MYLASHPVLFALLAATRHRDVTRLGGTVLVQGTDTFRAALTRLPLDRTGAGTTGGIASELLPGGRVLFDQEGAEHRDLRRSLAAELSAAGVDRLRPTWMAVLRRSVADLEAGGEVDLAKVAAELAGATVCALLGLDADPVLLAQATAAVAAAAAREHLPGIRRPGTARALSEATARLIRLLGPRQDDQGAVRAMLAVAAVNTTVAGLPRAVAWCADAGLWTVAADRTDVLAAELLRVIAPTALLPRVAAGDGIVGGRQIRQGDRLVLVARHAAMAHLAGPDGASPAAAQVGQLVFGAGPHACPGAALARAQLADTLAMLAPCRPVVVRARADRRSALPGWRTLVIAASRRV